MTHTYKEQINAIQTARTTLQKIAETVKMQNNELDAQLNDAASTIAAINLTPTLQEHQVLIELLKKVFLGKGTVDLDVNLLQQINDLVNPE